MKKLRLTVALAAATTAAAAAAPAQAGYFPGAPVDGPTGDIVSLGGVTLARGGAGDVGYLKREAGATHAFTAPLAAGNPGPPRRLDVGQVGDSSALRISSANDGRAVAAWINNGSVYAAVRPRKSTDWGPPQAVYTRPLLGQAASGPSLQQGPSGAAYVAFVVGGDVRVAWLRGTTFELLPQPLDIDPARTAGNIDLATSADGSAIVAWVEASKVFTRRVVRTRLSSAPREASLNSIEGQPTGAADSPAIDVEDDSSYAWIVIRQDTPGGSRVYSRRLVGSEYDPPVIVDSGVAEGETPDIDLSGRGRGLAGIGVRGSGGVLGGTIDRSNEWATLAPLVGNSPRRPLPATGISEDGRGTVAWHTQDATGRASVVGRYFNARQFMQSVPLEKPEFGPVDSSAGLDVTADLYGNQAIAWIQGEGGNRRVMVAVYDKEPRALTAKQEFDEWTRKRSFKVNWGDTDDPWGAIRYRIDIDGLPAYEGTRSSATLRNVGDGAHVFNVVTVDSRGQETYGRDRALYVDRRAPTGRITSKRSRRGRPAEITLNARDGAETLDGSGIDSAFVRWGDGSASRLRVPRIGVIDNARLGHRYRRRGTFRIRVELRDEAGNRRVVAGRVSVR